jgi:uncharacterized protein YecE (DUF72 family)
MRRKVRTHVGTSGWIYSSWTGPFYPPSVKGAAKLDFYAQRFHAVEVNATFYRLPSKAMAASWDRRLPEGFHLVLKGSRVVTHLKKLKDPGRALEVFLENALPLRHLRVLLWQLPPQMRLSAERLARVETFLAGLPRSVRHAVEFREESWWHPEVADVLRRHGAAFCAVSHPTLPETIWPTGDLLYLRFHGKGPRLYDYAYSREELESWAARARASEAQEIYAFFNNDIGANAPRDAAALQQMMGDGHP